MKPLTSISERPKSRSVSHAVTAADQAQITTDVERNLKLWGALEALRNGKFPSNRQLDKILRRLVRRCTITDPSVCADTLNACSNLRGLLETLRIVLREKNGDELAQRTAWLVYTESQEGSARPRRELPLADLGELEPDVPPAEPVLVDSDGESLASVETNTTAAARLEEEVDTAARDYASRDGELVEAARHVRNLAVIFFTNPELRAAITDLVVVARDLVKPKASEAIPTVTDTTDIASPGPDQKGSSTTRNATVAPAPTTPPRQPTPPPENSISSHLNDLFATLGDNHQHEGNVDLSGPTPQPPGAYWNDADDISEYTDAEEDVEPTDPPSGILADPRLAECVTKLKLAIAGLQDQEGYTAAMTWLLDTFETYENAMLVRSECVDNTPHVVTPTERILTNIATLFERFARGRSLGPIQRAIQKMYVDATADPTLRELWVSVDDFIRTALLEPGFIASDKCAAEAEALWIRIKTRMDEEFTAAQWNLMTSSLSGWFGLDAEEKESPSTSHWFPDDPVSRSLAERWTALISSLLLDSRGELVFKQTMYEDLTRLLLPKLKGMGYIPLPRVEFTSPAMELVMENIFISVVNILPTMVTFKADARGKWSPFEELRGALASSHRRRVRIQFDQVQADVRDMRVALRLKALNVADTAVVDVLLSRRGLSLDLDLEIDTSPGATQMIKILKAAVDIDELFATVRESASGHKRLYAVLLTVAIPLLKARMRNRLTQRLREAVERASVEMVELRRRIDTKPVGTDTGDGEEADGVSRILRIVLQRVKELKHEAEANRALPRKKKWKFSSRLEDAMFPNTTQDGEKSIVHRRWRAEERARLSALGAKTARRGRMVTDAGLRGGGVEEWCSPMFSFE